MRDILGNFCKNLFLWSPIFMAFGAALYFIMPTEPNINVIIITLLCILCAVVALWRRAFIILRAFAIVGFGFCYACVFTHFISTPQLHHNMHDVDVTAIVRNIDFAHDKTRMQITVAATDLGIDSPGRANLRLTIPPEMPVPNIGDVIRARVGVFAPSGAAAPGTFDYARWAYFNNLTATGYIGSYETLSHSGRGVNAMREWLHNRAASPMADGLVLGYKHSMPSDELRIWSTIGIGHIWSISGFHTTLIGGWLFIIFYTLFRCTPYITRRIPARKSATICAWVGLGLYLIISGMAVSTIRAFMMTSLMFMALLIGRGAISLRNVSIVFIAIFIMNPHYVMQAGFQLSFAAIYGLIWLWTIYNPRMPNNKILRIGYSATLTTVIATIFTAIFIMAHFYSFPVYGLIGNLILLPIFSVAILPLVMIGVACAIIGIYFPLHAAEYIYNITLNIATHIAQLPGANVSIPHVPTSAISITIIGLGTLVFAITNSRRINFAICGAMILFGVVITYVSPRPVFYTTHDNELVAFVYDGKLEFNKSRASNHYFAFNAWKQINREPTDTPNIRRRADHGVYIYKTPTFTLAYIQKFVPLARNIVNLCRDDEIDYIVSYFRITAPACHEKILHGGFVIFPSSRIQMTAAERRWNIRH